MPYSYPKEQLGKNIYVYLVKEKNNQKHYRIKHYNKTKIYFIVDNLKITYLKIKQEKYKKYLLAWITFNKEITIENCGNLTLSKAELLLLKDKMSCNELFNQSLKNKNRKLVDYSVSLGVSNFEYILLCNCEAKYTLVSKLMKNNILLIEKFFERSIYCKNYDFIKNAVHKIQNIDRFIVLANALGYNDIFTFLINSKIKKGSNK